MAGGWIAALAGWLFTYYNGRVQTERELRTDRINEQLREFHGPLLACVSATKSAYKAMISEHSPDGTKEGFQKAVQDTPEGPEARCYRLWMKEVMQPLNEKAANIITDHLDKLEAQDMTPMLLQLVAHVYAYRVILQRWSEGDLNAYSAVSFPDDLADAVRKEYERLKRIQSELLGTNGLRSRL